jgi:hypothetical protein
MKNIPNKEQAKEFDVFVDQWQTILNVHDWRIERSIKVAKNAMASVEMDDGARLASLRLGDFAGTPINSQSLSMTALHEVLHVFLYDLIQTARSNNDAQLEAEEHRVINVLEKLLGNSCQSQS